MTVFTMGAASPSFPCLVIHRIGPVRAPGRGERLPRRPRRLPFRAPDQSVGQASPLQGMTSTGPRPPGAGKRRAPRPPPRAITASAVSGGLGQPLDDARAHGECAWSVAKFQVCQQGQRESAAQDLLREPSHPPALTVAVEARAPVRQTPAARPRRLRELALRVLKIAEANSLHRRITADASGLGCVWRGGSS
jgi:hypothetical protein